MERLTVHSKKGLKLRKGKKFVELFADKSLTLNALNCLAELEDKLESGQLVKLPCKLDDDVYYIGNFFGDDKIIYCTQLANLKGYQIRNPQEFGYYTDKSQAEARLKELQE